MIFPIDEIDGFKAGCEVLFTGKGGYAAENKHARKFLAVGSVYKVSAVEVHSWHTKLFLEGFENTFFNHVMFELL